MLQAVAFTSAFIFWLAKHSLGVSIVTGDLQSGLFIMKKSIKSNQSINQYMALSTVMEVPLDRWMVFVRENTMVRNG